VKFDNLLARTGIEWMASHPGAVLRLGARRLPGLHLAFTPTRTSTEDDTSRNWIIAAISFYPVLFVGLIGSAVAWHLQRASVVLHAVIVASTLLYALTVICTRFRLPLDPFWIILASVAVASAWERVRAGMTSASQLEHKESGLQCSLPVQHRRTG
jgi:hypothetical protein